MSSRSLPLVALVVAVTLSTVPARAVDRTWTGGGDGQTWSDPLNWSSASVPGPADHAFITLTGTYTVRLTAPASVARLTLGGAAGTQTLDATGFELSLGAGPSVVETSGVLVVGRPGATSNALSFDGPVAVRGRLDWGSGQLYGNTYGVAPGAKVLTVAPGGLFRWTGAGARTLSAVLDNQGTIRWEGGPTEYYQGYQFLTSSGLFEIALAADVEFRGVGVNNLGPWIWASTGTVRKTGAGTVSFNQVELRTTGGSVNVQQGTLLLNYGARWENAAVAVAAGATLQLAGTRSSPHTVVGTLSGAPAGTLLLSGTPGAFNSTMAAAAGGATLNIGGTGLQVDNAELGFGGAPGETAPTNAGLVRFVGAADTYIAGTFRNEGTARWEAGRLLYSVTGAITNPGLFELAPEANADFITSGVNGGRPGPLVNTGTVRKTGAATATTNVEFNSVGGTLGVQGGTLLVQHGPRFENATVAVAAGATLQVDRSVVPMRVAGTLTGTPAGAVLLSGIGGWLSEVVAETGGGTLNLGGTGLQVGSGQLGSAADGGRAAPTNVGLLRLVGDSDKYVSGPFVNQGTLRWEAGRFFYSVTAAFTNAALFEMAPAADTEFSTSGVNGGRPGPLVNTGTIRRTGSGAITTNVEFHHVGGTVDVQGGTLRVQHGGRFENAAVTVAPGAALRLESGGPPTVVAGTLSGTSAGQFVLRQRTLAADPAGGRIDIDGNGLMVEYLGTLGGNPDGQGVRPAPVNDGLVRFVDIDATIGASFTNAGTLRWEAGILRLPVGATLTNAGVFEIAADGQTLYGEDFTSAATVLNAPGATLRMVGTGTTNLRTSVTNRGRIVVAAGTLRVENAGGNTNRFVNESGGTIAGVGTLNVAGLDFNSRVENYGTVAPGPSDTGAGVGTLSWVGRFVMNQQARIVAEVGPGTAGDRLAVSGAAGLASQLVVRVVGGYVPAVGDAFDVLTVAGARTGTFETVSTVNPTGAVVFQPDYADPARVALRAAEGQPAPPVVLAPDPLVNGAVRQATVFGEGLTPTSAVALVCVDCTDPETFARISGEVLGTEPGGIAVRFDLRDGAAWGTFDLVVRTGADSVRTRVRVDPYLAVPVVIAAGVAAAPIAPEPRAATHLLNIYNVSNAPDPTIFLVRLTPPQAPVRFGVTGVETAPDEPQPLDIFVPVSAALTDPTALALRLGVDPANILFPTDDPLIPGDPRIPFGATVAGETVAVSLFSEATFVEHLTEAVVTTAADNGTPVSVEAARAAVQAETDEMLGRGPAALQSRFLGGISKAVGKVVGGIGGRLPGINIGGVAGRILNPPGGGTGLGRVCTPLSTSIPQQIGDLLRQSIDAHQQQNPEIQNGPEMEAQVEEVLETLSEGGSDPLLSPPFPGCMPNPEGYEIQPRAPFDPNDKLAGLTRGCELSGEGENAVCARHLIPLVERDSSVTYTVRFENVATATAPAETVTITDVLDADFDPATLEVLATSADSTFSYTVAGQTVTFTFDGLDLPPNQTPPEGEGQFTFRVRPRPARPDGTEFRNRASIVFDFNPAIVTPEVVHVVRATADVAVAIAAPDFGPFQTPLVYTVRVANPPRADPAEAVVLTVPIPVGTTLLSAETTAGACSGTTTLSCALGTLAGGAEASVTVTVQLPAASGQALLTASATTATFDGAWYNDAASRAFGITNGTGAVDGPGLPTEVVLDRNRPNPFSGRTTFRVGLPASVSVRLTVVDLLGREVVRVAEGPMDAGWHEVDVEGRGLASGVYVAVLRAAGVVRTQRVLVAR